MAVNDEAETDLMSGNCDKNGTEWESLSENDVKTAEDSKIGKKSNSITAIDKTSVHKICSGQVQRLIFLNIIFLLYDSSNVPLKRS